VVSFTPRSFYAQGKSSLVTIKQQTGWAPEPVWTLWRTVTSLGHAGNKRVAPWQSFLVPAYTDCTIPAPAQTVQRRMSVWLLLENYAEGSGRGFICDNKL